MALRTGELVERLDADEAEAFNSFVGLHKLIVEFSTLDTRRLEELRQALGLIRLPPFDTPDWAAVRVEPDYGRSREVPLQIESWSLQERLWRPIHPSDHAYREAIVNYRGSLDAYVDGNCLEQDKNGGIYSYFNESRDPRVHVGTEALFYLVER